MNSSIFREDKSQRTRTKGVSELNNQKHITSMEYFPSLKNENSSKSLQPAFLINPQVVLDRNNSRNDSILRKIKQSDSLWSDRLRSALMSQTKVKDFFISRGKCNSHKIKLIGFVLTYIYLNYLELKSKDK